MKKKLSKSQTVCIVLLWAALVYVVLTRAERIDGPVVVTILLSAAFVFVPVWQSLKGKGGDAGK